MKRICCLILVGSVFVSPPLYAQGVGVNTDGATPSTNTILDVKSAGSTSSYYGLKVKNSGGTDQFLVRSDGNVGINTAAPVEKLSITGNVSLVYGSSRSFYIEEQPDNTTSGKTLTVQAGNASSTGVPFWAMAGGNLVLQAGNGYNASVAGADGGDVILRSGANHISGTDNGGDIILETGGANDAFTERMRVLEDGTVRIAGLAGGGTQNLQVDNDGDLVVGGGGGGGSVTSDIVSTNSAGTNFWTHPSVSVSVSWNNSTDVITVSNNSGGYWDICIIGAGTTGATDALSTTNDVSSGSSLTLDLSGSSTSDQGIVIFGADEDGSPSRGFVMHLASWGDNMHGIVQYY